MQKQKKTTTHKLNYVDDYKPREISCTVNSGHLLRRANGNSETDKDSSLGDAGGSPPPLTLPLVRLEREREKEREREREREERQRQRQRHRETESEGQRKKFSRREEYRQFRGTIHFSHRPAHLPASPLSPHPTRALTISSNPASSSFRSSANMAHVRQSQPDSDLGFQVKVLNTF